MRTQEKTQAAPNKSKQALNALTERLLADIQNGTDVFAMPFSGKLKGMPRNAVSGKVYRGANFWNVLMQAIDSGFVVNKYMTFNQAKEKGYMVKKGAKGLPVVFFRCLYKDENGQKVESEEQAASMIPFQTMSYVFNIGQIEGAEVEGQTVEAAPLNCALDWQKIGATVETHAVASAHYNVTKDVVMMPSEQMFKDGSQFDAALAHELIHWTGHKSRLDRKHGKEFGDKDYAREELVAEFGAAYLMAYIGKEYSTQHSAYIRTWSKELEPTDIEYAIKESQKAANWIIERLGGVENTEEAPKKTENEAEKVVKATKKAPKRAKSETPTEAPTAETDFNPEADLVPAPKEKTADKIAREFLGEIYLQHDKSFFVETMAGCMVNVTADLNKARKFSSITEAQQARDKEPHLLKGFKIVEIHANGERYEIAA